MALTRSLLRELNLEDSVIEQIIQAHSETVTVLKAGIDAARTDASTLAEVTAERDMLLEQVALLSAQQADAQQLQAEYEAWKAREQQSVTDAEKQQLIRQALLDAGANEKAVTLLAREIDPDSLVITGGVLQNAEEVIAPVREKYAAFFAQPVRLPASVIQPPASLHGALTRQDVAAMSAEEINANWDAVRAVLARA
ncbi:MAG: phage scaffolding protein [Aristaeellaceae bacterium]